MAPINDAVRAGDVEALRRELERGVPPDMRDENDNPPLLAAVQRKRADCVSMLLQWGADPNGNQGNNAAVGLTVLHLACYYGDLDCVRMLLEGGAAVNTRLSGPDLTPWLPIDYNLFRWWQDACSYFRATVARRLRASNRAT